MTQNQNQPSQECPEHSLVERGAQHFLYADRGFYMKEMDIKDEQFANKPIVLIGLSGAGKSTIGAKLAECLNVGFADMDVVFEEQAGQTISTYFEQYGELSFRNAEERILQELLGKNLGVIATGGGTILREKSRALLKERARVVYLDTTPEVLYSRLLDDDKRPLLKEGSGLMERLQTLHKQRVNLYMECAHLVINSGAFAEDKAIDVITSELGVFCCDLVS